jgi:hypothetical protein
VRHGGAALTPTDAIGVIGRQPFGRGLLLVVLAGLIGYSIWADASASTHGAAGTG